MALFDDYFELTKDTESARINHRWSCISTIASLIGSNVYIQFGSTKIYPNLYVMIVGTAGSRKSTAIKLSASLLRECNYTNLAASSTTREQFFEDFANVISPEARGNIELGLLDKHEIDEIVSPYTVIADEFNDFAGVNNVPMYMSLANLWDMRGIFEYRPKHGKKVAIVNPVLNILSGNTAEGFSIAFPAQTINQGLPSRMIIVNSLGRRRKIYWPSTPNPAIKARLVDSLNKIKLVKGELNVTDHAKMVLRDIYEQWVSIDDGRFATYGSRRYQQLLKLCIIVTVAYGDLNCTKERVVEANTILTYAEKHMPDAIGEFGLNKSSQSVARILDVIKYAPNLLITADEIYAAVSSDVKDFKECREIIMNLMQAKKIQITSQGITYIRKETNNSNFKLHCDLSNLYENETLLRGF